ncbi:MAG: hypothetical protein ACR2N9_07175 [Acidimicrobiia bacterium]
MLCDAGLIEEHTGEDGEPWLRLKNAKWLEISQTGFFRDPLFWTVKNR